MMIGRHIDGIYSGQRATKGEQWLPCDALILFAAVIASL